MTVSKYLNQGIVQLGANVDTTATTFALLDPLNITKLPSIANPWDYFLLTLEQVDGSYEIVKVTGISGSNLTVERAQEGTVAQDWAKNTTMSLNATAGMMDELRKEATGAVAIQKSSDFALTPEEADKIIEAEDGITITLNAMADFKDFSRLMIKNTSGLDVTLVPNGVETIGGEASYIVGANFFIELYKGTSGWEVKILSQTSQSSEKYLKMQGFLPEYIDGDTLHVGQGICTDSTGSIELSSNATLTADVNEDIGTGDGGMPKTVVKSGTFSSVGTAITGTGTNFTTEFKAGDVLYSTSNNEYQVVVAILNDVQMVIQLAFSVDVASDAVMKNGLAPFMTVHSILAYNPTTKDLKLVFDTQPNGENALADVDMAGYTSYRRRVSFFLDNLGALRLFTASEKAGGGVKVEHNGIIDVSPVPGGGQYNISIPFGVDLEACLFWIKDGNGSSSGELYSGRNSSDHLSRFMFTGVSGAVMDVSAQFRQKTATASIYIAGIGAGSGLGGLNTLITQGYIDECTS